MSYNVKLTIPKVQGENLKLYIYRSTNSNNINTIAKVSNINPVIIIDQEIAETIEFNGQECYQIKDEPCDLPGITYNGPQINPVPITEYETEVNLVHINSYTFVNELILSPLDLNSKEGIMFYYSVIAVNEEEEQLTHLSKVSGVLVDYVSESNLNRQVWSCDNYQDKETDEWMLVATIPFIKEDDKIKIGDINKPLNIAKLGLPIITTVPKIDNINVSLNGITANTFMVLQIENPWQSNNQKFNYRRLKSYKMRNVYENLYGDFSVPTYQSLLPVTIEKMTILLKPNPDNEDAEINISDDSVKTIEVIRKNGIFYDKEKHKSLRYNEWTIPLEANDMFVFSETSIQDTINVQVSAIAGNVYSMDVFLTDVYKNNSERTHYVIRT